jgi:TonB family protein
MKTLQSVMESWILPYLLNSLWQVPLVFCAALAAARVARKAGEEMEHRIWVGALFLEVGLPLCRMQVGDLWRQAWGFVLWFRHLEPAGGKVQVFVGDGSASRMALPWHTAEILAIATAAYLVGIVYCAGRLGWGMWTTESMRRGARRLRLNAQNKGKIDRFWKFRGLSPRDVQFVSSPSISGPATVGLWNHAVLLPTGFLDTLDPGELDALLAHEFAHIERSDFAKNLLYGILSLPAAYHPLLWLTRSRLAETRELVCDAMAAELLGGREGYARSLLRLASMLSDRRSPQILHAIGILDANIFERRVMNLTRKSLEVSGMRRLAIAAACTLVAVATCTSALALRMDVNQAPAKSTEPTKIHVKSDALKLLTKTVPIYPADAKKARIQGTVVLNAVIGKDGSVENLKAVSGPSQLQGSALDAVKDWKYQPFLLNGDPIAVETQIKVFYTLAK